MEVIPCFSQDICELRKRFLIHLLTYKAVLISACRTTMCSPDPVLKLAALGINIKDSWTDEKLVRFLAGGNLRTPFLRTFLNFSDGSSILHWFLSYNAIVHKKFMVSCCKYKSYDVAVI